MQRLDAEKLEPKLLFPIDLSRDSKSPAARRAGSSPAIGTTSQINDLGNVILEASPVCFRGVFRIRQSGVSAFASLHPPFTHPGDTAMTETRQMLEAAREALLLAESALATCYDVDSYPASGRTKQDEALAAVRAALSRLSAVPEGWKLVPVEPTDEMEIAAENDYEKAHSHFPNWKQAYRAMLSAAPPATMP